MDPILKLRMDAKSVVSDSSKGSSAKGVNGQAQELLLLLDAEPRETTRDEILHQCKTIVSGYEGMGQFKVFMSRNSVDQVSQCASEIEKLTTDEVIGLVNQHRTQQAPETGRQGSGVFIGHGGSQLYASVATFLQDDFGIHAHTFERHKVSGGQVIPTLEKLLGESGFAVIVATAEDEAEDASGRVKTSCTRSACSRVV